MATPAPEPHGPQRIAQLEERLKQVERWARSVNRRLKALETRPAPGPVPAVPGQELLEGEEDEEPAPPAAAASLTQGEMHDITFITTYGPLDVWRAQAEAGEDG